jgi:23S rRNA-/tRNA-specific pseudouridylate synthase
MAAVTAQFSKFLHAGVKVAVSDVNGLHAVFKPPGVLSHPNNRHPIDVNKSLLRARYDMVTESYSLTLDDGTMERCHLLHRLDSATSGLVLLATNEAVAHAVKREFAARTVSKLYKALVFCREGSGMTKRAPVTWTDPIDTRKVSSGGKQDRADVDVAVTEATLVAKLFQEPGRRLTPPGVDLCLLELRPKTGYTHQLRLQCRLHDMPIVGDRLHGDFSLNKTYFDNSAVSSRRMFLHASRIELSYDRGDGVRVPFSATATLPEDFRQQLTGKQCV